MVTRLVGERETDGLAFVLDLRQRITGRIQLSTDAGVAYPGIVFGAEIHYAQERGVCRVLGPSGRWEGSAPRQQKAARFGC